jgi:general secretion pathway protein L
MTPAGGTDGAGTSPIMLREFLSWWFGQLADLLPAFLRRTAPTAADATVVAPIGPIGGGIEAVSVGQRRGGKETPLGRFALGSAGVAELPQAGGRLTVLRLGEADVLGKTVTLPLAAERELAQVIAFEMDRETPFHVDELYWSHRVVEVDHQNERLSVRLQLVPKASLAPLLGALAEIGIVPERVEIADGPDAGACLPLLSENGSARSIFSRFFVPAGAAACAALAIAAAATPFVRQSIALADLDRQIASGRAEAAEAAGLRREIDRLSRSADLIQSERAKVGQPLEILAAVTRVMPDDSYLTELELLQRKLTLSGRSAAAAHLIGAFAADDEFRNPAFAAPVTRIEALRQEIFTIVAEVEP